MRQHKQFTQSRPRLLVESLFAYGFISILGKLVPLVMLPIVTRLMSDTADYGRLDMYTTIVSFASSIAGLGIYDAMFREYFERDDQLYRRQVTSSALAVVLISGFITAVILAVFSRKFSSIFLGNTSDRSIVLLSGIAVVMSVVQIIIAAPTRMNSRRNIYIISSVLGSLVYYAIAVLFITQGNSYTGMIYANLINAFLMFVFFFFLNKKEFDLKLANASIIKELLRIGVPLMPTFLAYWVFHSSDRIMLTNMQGLAAVGIYSVGSRVASISQIIYGAFAGGWQYFAFSTMKDEDQVMLNSRIMELLGVISFIAMMVVTIFDEWLFSWLFTGEYVQGVQVFPFLFLAPLLLMLFQIAASQALVYKKSYLCTISLFVGVLVNIALNYFLIRSHGIKGAALATLIGYSVSLVSILVTMVRNKWMAVSGKFMSVSLLTAIFIMYLYVFNDALSVPLAALEILLITTIYRNEIVGFGKRF